METNIFANKTVLLIDDDEDLLFLMKKRLQFEGFKVFISPNGENMFDNIFSNRPDIILLDIKMNGVDGSTICTLIKNNKGTSGIPVIMQSSNENIESITQQCGANNYIKKPFNLDVFRKMFSELLVA